MVERKDYIGPDPVAWVRRLRDVNEGAAFTQEAKDLIEDTLSKLERELNGSARR